jgi:ribosomal-protein-serine acetyltransferase
MARGAAALPLDLGDGVVLALTSINDAAEAFAVVDAERDRLREWLPWVDATVDVEVERAYLAEIEQVNASGAGVHATIRDRGGFCGLVGLRLDQVHRRAEIGYWLSERCVGRGIMSRAVAAMFDLAVTDLGMHRLELLAATGNLRSRAVAERLGMTCEGVRREAELLSSGFVDLVIYATLARDWPGAAAVLSPTGSGRL